MDTDAASESDEEEWTGTGLTPSAPQISTEDHAGSGKLNKTPMGEELRVIKDAADLFRSNSFKLQVRYNILFMGCKELKIMLLD